MKATGNLKMGRYMMCTTAKWTDQKVIQSEYKYSTQVNLY